MSEPGWQATLGLERPADAAVSTTALHWLSLSQLRELYQVLATLLRPSGLLLNGDHLMEDEASTPILARLGRAQGESLRARAQDGNASPPEDWKGFWAAAAADPALAEPIAERQRRRVSDDHHRSEVLLLDEHVNALRSAGFAEVGTLWQHGDNRVLCAVRGDG